jgi:hypothetical protein
MHRLPHIILLLCFSATFVVSQQVRYSKCSEYSTNVVCVIFQPVNSSEADATAQSWVLSVNTTADFILRVQIVTQVSDWVINTVAGSCPSIEYTNTKTTASYLTRVNGNNLSINLYPCSFFVLLLWLFIQLFYFVLRSHGFCCNGVLLSNSCEPVDKHRTTATHVKCATCLSAGLQQPHCLRQDYLIGDFDQLYDY